MLTRTRAAVAAAAIVTLAAVVVVAMPDPSSAAPCWTLPDPPPSCPDPPTTTRLPPPPPPVPESALRYAIPYGLFGSTPVVVEITGDHLTHSPRNRIDMKGVGGGSGGTYRIVAARAGTVRFIRDNMSANTPNASPCTGNNYVWIQHGTEWTKYSHVRKDSVTRTAGLSVGDTVTEGQFLGYEDDVGCASGQHLHWEVAVPTNPANPIDANGFIIGTNRVPRVCIPYTGPPDEPIIPTFEHLRDGRRHTLNSSYHANCRKWMG